MITKVSILLLYRRTITYDWTRITVWIFNEHCLLPSLMNISVVATACNPLKTFWDLSGQATSWHPPPPRQVYYICTPSRGCK